MPCSLFVTHTDIFLHSFESVIVQEPYGMYSLAGSGYIATCQSQVPLSLWAEDVVDNTYSPSCGKGASPQAGALVSMVVYRRGVLVDQRSSGRVHTGGKQWISGGAEGKQWVSGGAQGNVWTFCETFD